MLSETNPVYGPFFGVMGAAAAIIFSGKLTLDIFFTISVLFFFLDSKQCPFPSTTISINQMTLRSP